MTYCVNKRDVLIKSIYPDYCVYNKDVLSFFVLFINKPAEDVLDLEKATKMKKKARDKKYRKSENGRKTRRNYYFKNKKKMSVYYREYYREYNQRPEVKDKRNKYNKKYQLKPEVKKRLKEASKKYSQSVKGKDCIKNINRKRRIKKAGLKHVFTKEEWDEKVEATNGVCSFCNQHIGYENMTLDHILPISKAPEGFIYSIEDIQPMCRPCNSSKNNKITLENKQIKITNLWSN